jgi:hypothetical protein
VRYLKESGTYFVMCHDGAISDTPDSKIPLMLGIKHDLLAHDGRQMLTRTTDNATISSCPERLRKVNLRAMISWFISMMYNVALINELQCTDSKVSCGVTLSRLISF